MGLEIYHRQGFAELRIRLRLRLRIDSFKKAQPGSSILVYLLLWPEKKVIIVIKKFFHVTLICIMIKRGLMICVDIIEI